MLVLGQLEKKTFQQIAFFGFPRVVWPTPGCGIEIRDQDQALAMISEEAAMGDTHPAARGYWQEATTPVLGRVTGTESCLWQGPIYFLFPAVRETKIQSAQMQFSPLADIREAACLDKTQL